MRKKSESKKGFTLAELLIVVAIIAILLAILVPVFSSSRDSAILEKDAANVRSAYSEAVTEAMTDKSYNGGGLTVVLEEPASTVQCDVKYDSASKAITVTSPSKKNTETIPVDDNITIASENGWIDGAPAPAAPGGGGGGNDTP